MTWDHLGTPRIVTDQNGNVVARHDYLPFGEEVPGGSPGRTSEFRASDGIATKFTGQYRDSETGVDYFNARYFTGALGRFNSPDPMNAGADLPDPQTWNGYAYVRNNPLALVDPSGMDGEEPDPCDDDPYCGWFPPLIWFPPLPTAPPPTTTTVEQPVPPGSFPGGETLGLPPGMSFPGSPLGSPLIIQNARPIVIMPPVVNVANPAYLTTLSS